MPDPVTPTSTFHLLERITRGDDDAFAELFNRYRPRLALLVGWKLGPELRALHDVDDIVQEVFLIAARDVTRFEYRHPGSLMSWLARIADNRVRDLAREAGRQKRQGGKRLSLKSPSRPSGVEPACSVTPTRILAARERLAKVLERLERLPPDYREVVLLARVHCLATEEIAKRMGRTREAVAVLLFRALRALAAKEPEK